MNDVNVKLLNSLKYKEYINFLRNALGLKLFISNNRNDFSIVSRIGGNKQKKISERIKYKGDCDIVAYAFSGDDCVEVYLCSEKYYSSREYTNNNGTEYNVYEEFEILGDDILLFLLLLSIENYDYSLILNDNYDINIVNKLVRTDSFRYNFILGSGVSRDFGAKCWDKLIDIMRNNVVSLKKVKTDVLEKFERSLCNTNYVLPQIEKDIDKEQYFKDIYNSLYNKFNPTILKKEENVKDFSLYAIAELICTQNLIEKTQKILTFNYDDFLEQLLRTVFQRHDVNTVFKNGNNEKKQMINVVHPHGYMPYDKRSDQYDNSITLSTLEYMNAYNVNSYAYRKLYSQLDLTNIIVGNSLVDYEEQKVFRNHHKTYLSSYHFILTEKSDIQWANGYKILFYLRLGIIPIFKDKNISYSQYLKTLITKL